jgi:hypothetical protein
MENRQTKIKNTYSLEPKYNPEIENTYLEENKSC